MRFKKRHNIVFGKISGEAGCVKHAEIDDWMNNVRSKIKNYYKEDDIFNIDETGVFYNLFPDKTL